MDLGAFEDGGVREVGCLVAVALQTRTIELYSVARFGADLGQDTTLKPPKHNVPITACSQKTAQGRSALGHVVPRPASLALLNQEGNAAAERTVLCSDRCPPCPGV